jgi:hypothetical protein
LIARKIPLRRLFIVAVNHGRGIAAAFVSLGDSFSRRLYSIRRTKEAAGSFVESVSGCLKLRFDRIGEFLSHSPRILLDCCRRLPSSWPCPSLQLLQYDRAIASVASLPARYAFVCFRSTTWSVAKPTAAMEPSRRASPNLYERL